AALRQKADFDQALESLFSAIKYAQKLKDENKIASSYVEIANVYSLNGNGANAALYYKKGLETFRKGNDSVQLGKALFNVGDELLRVGDLQTARQYTREAAKIFEKKDFPLGQAYCLGNLGIIFAKMGQDIPAERNLQKAVDILQHFEDYNAIAEYLTYMADIYHEQGDEQKAIQYTERSLDLAQRYDLKDQLSTSNYKLSDLYAAAGDSAKAFGYYKNYITFRDSVTNLESVRQMADLRTNFEISQKQTEVDLLNQQKKNQKNIVIATIIALVLIVLLAFGLYRRNRFIRRTNLIIEKEKNRSEHLLLNILPEETAAELKNSGKVQAKRFEEVSVLFTDFKSFTHYAENLTPEELVESVDFYFSKFDSIVEKYGLEKIKTVGDSYMCAAGVPFPVQDHAERLIFAALEMVAFVNEAKEEDKDRRARFEIRLGINSGPVIAGVVGSKKFAYDIWGDTVNIASRMEACSETGKLNISENTYLLIKDKFECEYRGEIDVKNKGRMKMYFVNKACEEKLVAAS
ncbi:MAG: adenylate/guanylate cyclase domain-containing protein, partial [Salegentibacter sp.]